MNFLHVAVEENDVELVQKLIQSPYCNINYCNLKYNGTPLHIACRNNNIIIAKILINNGANVNIRNNYGILPLSLSNNRQVVKLLLQNGANVNVQDIFGWTPLHDACYSESYDVIEELLNYNADITIKNNDEHTIYDLANKNVIKFINYYLKCKEIWSLWFVESTS